VTTTIALEPVYNALMSLALLTADTSDLELDAWVRQTAAAMTPEQRHRNRLVFEGLGDALTTDVEYADFPAYLAALSSTAPEALRDRVLQRLGPEGTPAAPAAPLADATAFAEYVARRSPDAPPERALLAEVHALLSDPPALHRLIDGHLHELWETALAVEWSRVVPRLSGLVMRLQTHTWPVATAAETIRGLIGRELPDAIAGQLGPIQRLVVVPSAHVGLHASRFGSDTTIWVFVWGRWDELSVRRSPVKRVELIGPLSTLADETRLRILELLAQHEELPAQEIIAQVALSQPSVSRHLKQLCATGFVSERRGEGGNKRYRLNNKRVDGTFRALKQLLSASNAAADEEDARAGQPLALRRFLDSAGRVTTWPARRQDQDIVLAYLAGRFVPGRDYTEGEVTNLLSQWHTYGDPVSLRRALYDARLMGRTSDGARYWCSDAGPSS